jgi:hypothetical protein
LRGKDACIGEAGRSVRVSDRLVKLDRAFT